MTNYYVSTSGSDSTGTGAIGAPWLTIGKPDTGFVGPGDVVNVAPGTYVTPGVGHLSTSTNGTAGARIRYISTVIGAALVRTNNVNGVSDGRCWQNDGSYIDIIGFDISSTDTAARIGLYYTGNYCLTQQCIVHDLQAAGNFPSGGGGINHGTGTGNQAIRNIVHDIGTLANDAAGSVHGIYCSVGDYVWNNIVYKNSGFGIHSWHNSTNLTICNNLVYENGNAGNTGGGIIVSSDPALGGSNDFTKVHNNIVRGNHGKNGAIDEFGNTGTHNTYMNNLVYLNDANLSTGKMINLLNGLVDTGTLTSDPLLVNYQANGSGDYHLTSSSPCINAGTSLGMPATDYDGRLRAAAFPTIGPYVLTAYAFSMFRAHA